jgi:DNA polymerase III alpha subunit
MNLGEKDWDFVHPALKPILGDTHDVCAFQEDVTKICHQVAGLSYCQADKVRKMMNSLHEGILTSGEWKATSEAFLNGCVTTSGLNRGQALELWERVSSFTGFSFCKSHSASYAQLSFQCAYLKCHYPAQFLASVISNNHGFYSRDVYLDEARRWGIRILPMDINESRIQYTGKQALIRPGLMHVRNLSGKSLDAIIGERARCGRYHNIVDFVSRVPVHKRETEHLIKVGAFDSFGLTQPELISLLDAVYGKLRPDQPELFANDVTIRSQELHPGLRDYTLTEKCLNELHLLGFMLSGNILDILDLHPASRGTVSADSIHKYAGRRVKVFGWPVTARTHFISRSGRLMKFLTLEDRTECMDVIFWPDTHDRFADILGRGGPFEVWGRVSEDWGTYTIEADSLRGVDWSPAQVDFEAASKKLEKSFTGREYTYADIQKGLAA